MTWTADEVEHVGAAEELEIATPGADGVLRRFTPIWVVVVDEAVYVRTWHRRDTGWFGRAVRARRARVRVPGVEIDVQVSDVGAGHADLTAAVDAAYRAKYGRYGSTTIQAMVSADAVAATLRLDPDQPSGDGAPTT